MKKEKIFTKKITIAATAISLIAGAAWSQAYQDIIYNEFNIGSSNEIKDLAGVTSLMSAVANNDLEGVKFFSTANENIINEKNIGGATALNIAARSDNIEAAKILLENKADINIADNEGWTPLMRAANSGNLPMIELFLKYNADIYAVNSENNSALVYSAYSDCSSCLEKILAKAESDKVGQLTQQIENAFQIAQNRKNEEIKTALTKYLTNSKNSSVKEIANSPRSNLSANGNVKYVLNNSEEKMPAADKKVVHVEYEAVTKVSDDKISEPAIEKTNAKFKFVTDKDDNFINAKTVLTASPSETIKDDNNFIVSNKVIIGAGISSASGTIYKFKSGTPKIENKIPQKTIEQVKAKKNTPPSVEKKDAVKKNAADSNKTAATKSTSKPAAPAADNLKPAMSFKYIPAE